MKSWEEIIAEAKSKREQELEDRVSELDDVPSSLKKDKKKKSKKEKEDSAYTKYLKKQLKFKTEKYRDQQKRQLEKIKEKEQAEKERASKESLQKAKDAISGINIRKVGAKDSAVTGVQKSVETAGSFAKGLTGAAFHGISALVKRRREKKAAEQQTQKAQSSQPEKKAPGKPGRPKSDKSNTVSKVSVRDVSSGQSTGTPERKKLVPSTKRLPPATKKIAPSGGTPYQAEPAPRRDTGMSLGQRARRNPELKKRLMAQRNETYSDWKTEFLLESGLLLEVGNKDNDKDKKQKVIDVMRGKNKIEMNPSISEDHKEIASGKKKDDEGYMANVELDQMERAIKSLRKKVKKSDTQLPAWVQSKITRAADYIDTASEYLQSEEGLSEEMNKKKFETLMAVKSLDNAKKRKNSQLINGIIGENNESLHEIAPALAAIGRVALGAGARKVAGEMIKDKAKEIAVDKVKEKMQKKFAGDTNETGSGENPIDSAIKGVSRIFKIGESAWSNLSDEVEISEAKKSEMKCNKPKAQAHGSGETGKSHVVKACEGGKEKLIRFGQLGVKGSPKKEGESEAYANRRKRFKTRHAKNIAKGKMSAAYWADKVKW
jgi:hypothetical protein